MLSDDSGVQDRKLLFERSLGIAQQLFSRGADPDDPQIVELYEELGRLHVAVGQYKQAEQWFHEALTFMLQTLAPPPTLMIRMQYGLARVDERRGHFDRALMRMREALLIQPVEPSSERIACMLLGAGLYSRLAQYTQALSWLDQALEMAEVLGSTLDRAEVLKYQGSIYRNTGDHRRSYDLLMQSKMLFQELDAHLQMADITNNLANSCVELGRLEEAQTYFQESILLKRKIGDIYGEAMTINNIGDVLLLKGDLESAITHYREAFEICTRIGSRYLGAVAQMNLGAAYLLCNDLAHAEAYLRSSANELTQAGAEDFLPELERYQAELALRSGDLNTAKQRCEQALQTALRLKAQAEEGITRRLLAEIMARSGDQHQAWDELKRSLAILRDADAPYEIARTLIAIAALAQHMGMIEDGRAALTEALSTLETIGALRDLEYAQAVALRYPA